MWLYGKRSHRYVLMSKVKIISLNHLQYKWFLKAAGPPRQKYKNSSKRVLLKQNLSSNPQLSRPKHLQKSQIIKFQNWSMWVAKSTKFAWSPWAAGRKVYQTRAAWAKSTTKISKWALKGKTCNKSYQQADRKCTSKMILIFFNFCQATSLGILKRHRMLALQSFGQTH